MDKMISSVGVSNGVPALFVNGEKFEGAAYITYYTHRNCYKDFADAGYRLFSMPVFFSERSINAVTGIPPFGPGMFDKKGESNFTYFDEDVKKILDACPDAYIFPRINMTLPLWWDEENPDELNDEGFRNEKRACFSSKKWAEQTKSFLKELVEHVDKMPYKNHIIGYQLAGGNTEEWISFDLKGSIGKRSRERFLEYIKEFNLENTEEEYYGYLSYIVAKSICDFCGYMKELTNNSLVMGAFYGYTFELVKRTTCHHALQLILENDAVDFICSPVSYDLARVVGMDHVNMLPIDSLKLHKKLYFVENDTRTHLSGPPNELPYYNSPLWKGPAPEITREIIKMHFSRALLHGHAFWWFDMWGKWYQTDDYMPLFKDINVVVKESLKKPLKSVAKLAVFADEKAYKKIPDECDIHQKVCYEIRRNLGKIAVPYDIYLMSDFETVKDKYDAIIFLVPARTELVDKCESQVQDFLEINETNYDISTDTLREFCKNRGVMPYFNEDAVVYENESYFFLHTCVEGEYTFPENLIDAFTKEKVTSLKLEKGKSVLLEKV